MSETTDIAEARAEEPDALRNALLDQLAHLLDEVEALRTVVEGVPEQIKEGRPTPDALTMKEIYGALALLDAEVRRPRITRIVDEADPVLEPVDTDERVREAGWNEQDMDAILDQVTDARRALVDQLEALPLDTWHRSATLDGDPITLFDLVHRMTQVDAERLRSLGYRLHNAHLSKRDEPLPT